MAATVKQPSILPGPARSPYDVTCPKPVKTRRELGSSELSYFTLGSYLHIGLRGPKELLERNRLQAIWAIERARHPLLSARILPGMDVSMAAFEYSRPESVREALERAGEELNGPRLLSTSRTSFLIVAREPGSEDEWHLILCAMHCIGDETALHACANEMMLLLGNGKGTKELVKVLDKELNKGIGIPRSMEASLPEVKARLKNAAAKVDEGLLARKQIGGQAFPRVKRETRKTVVLTVSFDEARTKRILAKCKVNGVSVSNVLFALCNIAWARILRRGIVTAEQGAELPQLMYTALNTRPWQVQLSESESFFRLCIGYFNIILPSFVPSTEANIARTFWHRARLAKIQSTKAIKSPFALARTHLTATKYAQQSIAKALIDDGAVKECDRPPTLKTMPVQENHPVLQEEPRQISPVSVPSASSTKTEQTAPSTALMGLSLLGNLDATYKHTSYGAIRLHSLTTGSRLTAGEMLLLSYTFAGKLWLCFGYDQNGFAEGVVEEFWKEVLGGADNFLDRNSGVNHLAKL